MLPFATPTNELLGNQCACTMAEAVQLVLDAVRKEISKKELQVDTTRAKKAREIGQHLLLFGKDDDLFVTFCQTLVTALKSCFTTSRLR